MAKGSNKVQEPKRVVKKKSWKPCLTKDAAHHPPTQDKVKTKKKTNPNKNVHSLLDRIRHTEPQKEKNVAREIKKQSDGNSLRIPSTHVAQWVGWWGSSQALDGKKESEVKVKRLQHPSEIPSTRNLVPLKVTPRNHTQNRAMTSAAAPAVEMAQHSRLGVPQAQQPGLSALAPGLQREQKSPPGNVAAAAKTSNVGEAATEVSRITGGGGSRKADGEAPSVSTEVSDSTEPRFITPKEVALFEDWRPGAPKLDKPPSVDGEHWLAVEMEKQQDSRVAKKLAMKKKQVRYLESVGEGDATFTPLSKDQCHLNAHFTIKAREIPRDIEESARGYADFLYRPGAAWMHMGSTSTSSSDFRPPQTKARPKSCEARKTTEEIVLAIASANARRELMRKELTERLRQDLIRKKFLVSQLRATSKRSPCRCY